MRSVKCESEAELIDIMKSAGLYEPFDCSYCRAKDNFVSGPHSHICSECGGHAIWGWYARPLCDVCHLRLGPLSHWDT